MRKKGEKREKKSEGSRVDIRDTESEGQQQIRGEERKGRETRDPRK